MKYTFSTIEESYVLFCPIKKESVHLDTEKEGLEYLNWLASQGYYADLKVEKRVRIKDDSLKLWL